MSDSGDAAAMYANECAKLRARLSAAESRLREYEDAPVKAVLNVTHGLAFIGTLCPNNDTEITEGTHELIIRPRGGKGE